MNFLATKQKTETEAAPASPRTLDGCPEYVAARARVAELQHQQTEVRQQLAHAKGDLNSQLSNHRTRTAAEVIFDGEEPSLLTDTPLQKTCAGLQRRLLDFDEAIRMQRQVESKAMYQASKEIAKTYLPEYKQAVSELKDALTVVRSALLKETSVRHKIDRLGIQYTEVITPCPLRQLGEVNTSDTERGNRVQHIDAWLEHAADSGML